MCLLQIVNYEDKYQNDLMEISIEWLQKYDLLEEADLIMLRDPVGTVIDEGGHIYFALYDGEVAGTISLEKMDETSYEILKFGVKEKFQGFKIGKSLLEKVINVSKEEGKQKIILCSNHKLANALHLYEKFGFEHVPYEKSKFDLSDIKMEMIL